MINRKIGAATGRDNRIFAASSSKIIFQLRFASVIPTNNDLIIASSENPWVRIASSVPVFDQCSSDRSQARWKRCVPRVDFHSFSASQYDMKAPQKIAT